jgi:hypothetical protein
MAAKKTSGTDMYETAEHRPGVGNPGSMGSPRGCQGCDIIWGLPNRGPSCIPQGGVLRWCTQNAHPLAIDERQRAYGSVEDRA